MKCARCYAELPAQSQFCLRCGKPVEPTATAPFATSQAVAAPLVAPRSNTNKILFLILALAVLAIGGLGASLLQKRGKMDTGQMVQAPGQGRSGAMVQAPGQGRDVAMVQAPGETRPAPLVQVPGNGVPNRVVQEPSAPLNTSDISYYLARLKEIERRKIELHHTQSAKCKAIAQTLPAEMLKGYMNFEESDRNTTGKDTADPRNRVSAMPKMIDQMVDEWNQLTVDFNRLSPPQSCATLHTRYFEQLSKIQTQTVQVLKLLQNILSTPREDVNKYLSEAMGMQGISKGSDAAIDLAEEALADVCQRYNVAKEFKIGGKDADVGGMGGLTNMFGGG